MKKRMLILTSALMVVFLFSNVFAQQVVEKGDTLIVSPSNEEGQPLLGALNMAIHGDTTEAGERKHKVYKLYRNAQYILTAPIQINSPIEIVADEPDAENRPPVIRCGTNEDGGTVARWWYIYADARFENIWVSGINLDGNGPIDWISQTVNASGITIEYDGCIVEFPYTWWATFADWGGRNVYKITDCVFKNIGNPTGTTWNGAVFHNGGHDSTIVKNTTFYKFGAFAIHGSFYTEIDHCTFVNSVVHPIDNHRHVIRKYSNNLFVNCHAFSDDTDEIMRHFDKEVKGIMNYAEIQWDPQELDSLYGPGGTWSKNYDPNGDGVLEPHEQVWELKNNAWYYTQPIRDYWDSYPSVVPNPWMNNYTEAMFNSSDNEGTWNWDVKVYTWADSAGNIVEDPSGGYDTLHVVDSSMVTQTHQPYLYFQEENTMNVEPGIVDMQNTDELLAQNCDNIRKSWAGEEVEDVKWHGVDNYLAFEWPLPFDLSYTNTELQTAGTDGKPVGALHWWSESGPLNVARNNNVAEKFELSQNYPNPFNPTTNISYKISKPGMVKLTVYNLLGEKVRTLVNENKTAGNYNVIWNAMDDAGHRVSSGIYFYKLQSGSRTDIKKMMLLK